MADGSGKYNLKTIKTVSSTNTNSERLPRVDYLQSEEIVAITTTTQNTAGTSQAAMNYTDSQTFVL